ncbi:uncharacterized protein HMPREF1541_09432 [Cyphellophora europaea CBS 101466]|uniref:Uncharacterized protein n=1 Tax=Cyphellophora europaea (strain CBS 101466) TaxID=1220924 RepID=W2SAD7_CYPE1|nr:uncharacterized protein HMPREF1541_09432 [Cyphellophora europaea CBS 101466]ETN45600.1 hypothetical protein HMPREF1541_09432 [Cyphellophora europaea CBS 101466]
MASDSDGTFPSSLSTSTSLPTSSSPSVGNTTTTASKPSSTSTIPSPQPHQHTLSPETTPLSPVKSPTDAALPASYPLAAQIPISSFATLPTFPPEASHLRALTLTADLPLTEYQNLLKGGEYALPEPPQSITHLTLELFSLGFPGRNPHWLANLARALPNLKSVTFFSCLIDGLDDASRADALEFFDLARVLRECHVIDSFARPGFWSQVGKLWAERARDAALEREADGAANGAANGEGMDDGGVKVVEVSYTYRGHEDSDFLARCHGEELAALAVSGLVGFGAGMVEESEGDTELGDGKEIEAGDEKKGKVGGILPYASDSRAAEGVKTKFKELAAAGDLAGLKVLNLGLWTLSVSDIKELLSGIKLQEGGTGLIDLTLSVLMSEGWAQGLVDALAASPAVLKNLEGIEIIGVPSMSKPKGSASGPAKTDEQIDNIMDTGDEDWASAAGVKVLDEKEVALLGEKCPRLAKVDMSILKAKKAGLVGFVREGPGEAWKKA